MTQFQLELLVMTLVAIAVVILVTHKREKNKRLQEIRNWKPQKLLVRIVVSSDALERLNVKNGQIRSVIVNRQGDFIETLEDGSTLTLFPYECEILRKL